MVRFLAFVVNITVATFWCTEGHRLSEISTASALAALESVPNQYDVLRPTDTDPEKKTKYQASVAIYNQFCPLRCPDVVVIPQDDRGLAKFLQKLQEKEITFVAEVIRTRVNPQHPPALSSIRGNSGSWHCQRSCKNCPLCRPRATPRRKG